VSNNFQVVIMLCGELRKLIRWALSWWALSGTYALIGIDSEDRETGRAGRLASSASERLCDVNRGRSADAGRRAAADHPTHL